MATSDTANAQGGYEKLRTLWDELRKVPYVVSEADSFAGGQGFWHGGNTLDTFMDYLGRAKPGGFQKAAAELADQGIAAFTHAVGVDPSQPNQPSVPAGKWWDDYGWWGLAFLKAYLLTGKDEKYLNCARACWQFMEKGGRHYLDPDPPEGKRGGTWNHSPEDGTSAGVQNTITNSLFLNLSAQMYHLTREEHFLECACAQFDWFRYWFTKDKLLTIPDPHVSKKLIKEFNSDGGQDFYWTGDQGALLGWLMSFMEIGNEVATRIVPPDPGLGRYLGNLGDAVAAALMTSNWTVKKTNDGKMILHDDVTQNTWLDVDWATGKGVAIRYLVAWLQYRGALALVDNANFIRDNAQAVASQPKSQGYFPLSWTGDATENSAFDNSNGYKLLNLLTFQCSGQDAQSASLLVGS